MEIFTSTETTVRDTFSLSDITLRDTVKGIC